MKILGISRSPRFSPNSTARDAAIFEAVGNELRQMGHTVETEVEDDFTSADGYELVFSMGRDLRFLQLLSAEELGGLPVVNSALSLLHGTRTALSALFERENVPVAVNIPVLPGTKPTLRHGQRYWLKRGEACAQSAGDVRLITTPDELAAALRDFEARGIREALLSEHIEGDLVKFYGVEGTDFFYHYYPTAKGAFSKFGLEKHNGAPVGYDFDLRALKADADRAASLSGLTVYGGDCVVRPDGSFLIIDFNDWPSFSLCCDNAAKAIAERLCQRAVHQGDGLNALVAAALRHPVTTH
ncbi:MAG: hypothetical protein Q4E59_06235 [Bacteroidales bacterium]|nr:hypothetical protein [Bacteroidales bacterium]